MEKGFYVVRMPANGAGSRLIVESRCFHVPPTLRDIEPAEIRGWVKENAENWRGLIQSQHPKDDVFVIER